MGKSREILRHGHRYPNRELFLTHLPGNLVVRGDIQATIRTHTIKYMVQSLFFLGGRRRMNARPLYLDTKCEPETSKDFSDEENGYTSCDFTFAAV